MIDVLREDVLYDPSESGVLDIKDSSSQRLELLGATCGQGRWQAM